MFKKAEEKNVEPIETAEILSQSVKNTSDEFDVFIKDEPVSIKNEEPDVNTEKTTQPEITTKEPVSEKLIAPNITDEKEQEIKENSSNEKYKELETLSGLWSIAKQDPVGFINNIISGVEQLPDKEKMIEEVKNKFGEDFDYDPVEAYRNPKSDSAKYKREIDKIEVFFQMKELEIEQQRKRLMAETEQVYKEGQQMFGNIIQELKKEYSVTDKEIEEIILDLGEINPNQSYPQKLKAYNNFLCKYLRMAVIAKKGLNKLKDTISVEKKIDAVAGKIPTTPTSGKSLSPPKSKEKSINDILMEV